MIKRIYQPTTDDVHEVILKEYVEASHSEPKVVPGFSRVLSDPEYRTATYVGIYLALSV